MKDKLNSLPIEALFKLKEEVELACQRRRYDLFKPGRQATFDTKKRGAGFCRIMITGMGPKNVMGYEIDAQGNHLTHSKWRVHPSVLKPVFDQPKPAAKPLGVGADRPTMEGAGSF